MAGEIIKKQSTPPAKKKPGALVKKSEGKLVKRPVTPPPAVQQDKKPKA